VGSLILVSGLGQLIAQSLQYEAASVTDPSSVRHHSDTTMKRLGDVDPSPRERGRAGEGAGGDSSGDGPM
jgi:hypothetical protein